MQPILRGILAFFIASSLMGFYAQGYCGEDNRFSQPSICNGSD